MQELHCDELVRLRAVEKKPLAHAVATELPTVQKPPASHGNGSAVPLGHPALEEGEE